LGSAVESVDEGLVEQLAAQEVIELEMSAVAMILNIYTYESYTFESEEE
jgi:hypothetical protein